jgi:hypothetical protein
VNVAAVNKLPDMQLRRPKVAAIILYPCFLHNIISPALNMFN